MSHFSDLDIQRQNDLDDLMDEYETYCRRCQRTNTDARDVYYPASDEFIHLCTDCEPDDIADSSFCHTFASTEHLRRWEANR